MVERDLPKVDVVSSNLISRFLHFLPSQHLSQSGFRTDLTNCRAPEGYYRLVCGSGHSSRPDRGGPRHRVAPQSHLLRNKTLPVADNGLPGASPWRSNAVIHRRFFRLCRPVLFALLGLATAVASASETAPLTDDLIKAGHVLNRIAYGPSPLDLANVGQMGVQAYIEQQLAPESIDESRNTALLTRTQALFDEQIPSREESLIAVGQLWRYAKGTEEPNPAWTQPEFRRFLLAGGSHGHRLRRWRRRDRPGGHAPAG